MFYLGGHVGHNNIDASSSAEKKKKNAVQHSQLWNFKTEKKQTTFCVHAETTSQLLWAQTDRQVEVTTSGVGVKHPISATATSCDCGGRLTTSFETFLGAHNTHRTAEMETREPGQHFQVFDQMASGLLHVNGVMHQHNNLTLRITSIGLQV